MAWHACAPAGAASHTGRWVPPCSDSPVPPRCPPSRRRHRQPWRSACWRRCPSRWWSTTATRPSPPAAPSPTPPTPTSARPSESPPPAPRSMVWGQTGSPPGPKPAADPSLPGRGGHREPAAQYGDSPGASVQGTPPCAAQGTGGPQRALPGPSGPCPVAHSHSIPAVPVVLSVPAFLLL